MKNIFTSADILLPYKCPCADNWSAWSVIACDQFTSEPEYWAECASLSEGKPSAYKLVLPEAYLGTEMEETHKSVVAASMKNTAELLPCEIKDTIIYIERTLPDGGVRYGIVGKVDLEAYDYNKGSTSAVRATEATVLERIPPRCAIRAEADVELPHVMLFGTEKWSAVISLAKSLASSENANKIYDFDLMQGGGHLVGYAFTGDALSAVRDAIAAYEAELQCGAAPVIYAVGDGNHSLAAAKAHFENLKAQLGDSAMTHPARYALTEIVSLDDASIEFEPIFRIVKDCDAEAMLAAFKAYAGDNGTQAVTVITEKGSESVMMNPTHALTVGTLQNFIDPYLQTACGECDYIHGEDVTERLASKSGCIGFIFEGMEKSELFDYVEKNGALPRKTFSMGSARTKRYYTEARRITK